MQNFIIVIIELIVIILLADLISGVAHWIQDRFDSKYLYALNNMIIYHATEHHETPDKLLQYTWLERNKTPFIALISITAISYFTNILYWEAFMFFFIFLFSGEIHYYSHQTPKNNGRFISFLQKMKLIQDPSHHATHHKTTTKHYCIITNTLNPLLDFVRLFERMDNFLLRSPLAPFTKS